MALDGLFQAIAREQDRLLSTSPERAVARRRLLTAVTLAKSSQRSSMPWLAAAIACVAIGTSGVAFWNARSSRPLTAEFGASQTPVTAGAWLDAPAGSATPLRFSDGTQIELAPRGRLRLIALQPRGAHIAVESGRASVNVAHGEDRNWELRAGPFLVRVTGTRFDLDWEPNADSFELVLTEGQVELVGCGFGSGRKLVAGQRVHASCRENSVQIAYNPAVDSNRGRADTVPSADAGPSQAIPRDPSPREESACEAPANCEALSTRETAQQPPHAAVTPPNAAASNAAASASNAAVSNAAASSIGDWIALARQGKYADALRTVSRMGYSEQCARLRADELALLGDTARRAGDATKARSAYVQLRQRFAGNKQASLAAFHLGLLEFDNFGAYPKAASWFRTYLSENPTGPLTREARGRLMEAAYRMGSGEAPGLASSYLRDYPSGPHAQLARRIASTH